MSGGPGTVWRDRFRVRFFDTDPTGRASVAAVCRYLQEAADSHTRPYQLSLTDLLAEGRMWVLSRLAIQFVRMPRLAEEVAVDTWGSNRLGGLRAYRDFRMLDEAGETLAEASSMWLILDAVTKRPVRLPESILVFRHAEWRTPEAVDAVKLDAPSRGMYEARFRVGWRDLDANRHANNVRYVEWMLEALPDEIFESSRLVGVDIQFVGEAARGDEIVSASEAAGDGAFRHGLTNGDGAVLAVGRSVWK
ncbi:MAG: acyl-ACP thioesterase domain-containing protein [Bryobacteraceae bacterium]